VEPSGRDTDPAMARVARSVAGGYGSEAILLVLAADRLIVGRESFEAARVDRPGVHTLRGMITPPRPWKNPVEGGARGPSESDKTRLFALWPRGP
jgi:hypothetical protein